MTRSTRHATALCGLLLQLAGGCSLAKLGELEIPQCTHNSQCAPLNELHGLSTRTDCRTYVCRADGDGCELGLTDVDGDGALAESCRETLDDVTEFDCDDAEGGEHRFPGNLERCDGIDNDCDLIVDEGLLPEGADTMLELDADDGDERLYFGDAQGDPPRRDWEGPVFVRSLDGEAIAERITTTPLASVDTLEFRYQLEQDEAGFATQVERENCPTAANVRVCNFRDTAATYVDHAWMIATVSSVGCAAGQLRVGYRDEGSSEVGLRGPQQHSDIYAGVDVADDQCTGASRASGVRGASAPALAGHNGDIRQALLAFLADTLSRDACGGEVRDVEVLGVWLEELGAIRWTNGTNGGVPQVLGQTRGGGRPVLQAMRQPDVPLGYLAAYGHAEGGLALHRLPLFDDPPAYSRGQSEPRSTEPLELGTMQRLFPDHEVDQVALTQIGVVDDHVELGLSWVEGCGSTQARVFYAAVRYFWGDHTFEATEPVELAVVPGLSEPASVLHIPRGFVSEGYERSGKTASSATTGGTAVAFRDGDSLLAVRVLDLDGQPLEEARLTLRQGDARAVHLFYAGTAPRFAAYNFAAGQLELETAPLTCALDE